MVGLNEFTDFVKFGIEHPPRVKSMFMSISAQHPRYRYYSSAEPLYESRNNNTRERRKALKSRQRNKNCDFTRRTAHQLQYFMKFSIFEIFEFHDTKANYNKLCRSAFV